MRIVKRWIAECPVAPYPALVKGVPGRECKWNERKDQTLHLQAGPAKRESMRHFLAEHATAREVEVRRTYKPRELEREEVIE